MAMTIEQIHIERPVTNTFHNVIQCLSVKLDSAARYGLYADDAREDGMPECAEMFDELAAQERAQIERLLGWLPARANAPHAAMSADPAKGSPGWAAMTPRRTARRR